VAEALPRVAELLTEIACRHPLIAVRLIAVFARLSRPVYLTGECAQADWGAFGSIAVGNTRRRLSFFVMVLA
jgi:hypothetical protein